MRMPRYVCRIRWGIGLCSGMPARWGGAGGCALMCLTGGMRRGSGLCPGMPAGWGGGGNGENTLVCLRALPVFFSVQYVSSICLIIYQWGVLQIDRCTMYQYKALLCLQSGGGGT